MQFLKKRLSVSKDIICYSFDPWYFNSQEVLISQFFETLYEEICRERFIGNFSLLLFKYSKLLGGSSKDGALGSLLSPLNIKLGELDSIKDELRKCVGETRKKIVVFIDNIDRLEKDEILLTFKLVHLCSDFNNLMFVVFYDKDQVLKKISQNSQGSSYTIAWGEEYIKKIFQAQIALPEPRKSLVANYWCKILTPNINDIVEGLDVYTKKRFQNAMDSCSKLVDNMRIAKVYCNWISLKTPICISNKLNYVDFFVIETIAFFYSDVYKFLKNNSRDIPYYAEYEHDILWTSHDHRVAIHEQREALYKKIFEISGDSRLQELLGLIFESLHNFSLGIKEYWGGNPGGGSFSTRPIDDQRYFNSYFSFSPSETFTFALNLNNVLDSISNSANDFEMSVEAFSDFLLNIIENGLTKEFIKQVNMDDLLDDRVWEIIITGLYKNSRKFSYDNKFLGRSEHDQIGTLIASRIKQLNSDDKRNRLLSKFIDEAEELYLINIVFYSLDSDRDADGNRISVYFDKFRDQIIKRLNNIINSQDNIFQNPAYYRDFECFINYLNIQEAITYATSLINKDISNIVGFLNLFTQRVISSDRGVYYEFNKERYQRNILQFIVYDELNLYVESYKKSLSNANNDTLPMCIKVFDTFYQNIQK